MKRLLLLSAFISVLAVLIGCEAKVETPGYESYKSYYPLTVGKYITYRLDSTLLKTFGTGFETKSYTVKDVIEEQFTDNSNRIIYKIVRYKLEGTQWVPNNTFTVTPLENGLEFVENNLRIIKLVNPVKNEKNWSGNAYLNYSPFFPNSDFQTWVYSYTNMGTSFRIDNQILSNTVTVTSFDSTTNKPFYNKGYSSYAKGYEVYAKDIGTIYRDILNWEYQVFTTIYNCKRIKCTNNICDTSAIDCNTIKCDSIKMIAGNKIYCDTSINRYNYDGYGVKLRMIDHN